MDQNSSLLSWCKNNREMAIEFLRIYLGLSLFIKGLQFIINQEYAQEYMTLVTIPFFEYLSMHVVSTVHIAGGLLMTIGLITRAAALIQAPILLGAIFFVHLQQGLFTKSQSLELVILVFFLLLVFAIYGGGRLSVDYILDKRNKKL